MADLAEFLLARIAEDEHFGTHDRRLAKRWDAECEAKRRIVGRFAPHHRNFPGCVCGRCDALRDIAAVYADHPDYREEWKL